jgi:hypothetical protein
MYFDGALNLEGAGARVLSSLLRGTTQVRLADTLLGLQQWNRVQSPDSQTPHSSVSWHQATTRFW